jgi:hypothetical protein
MIFARSLKTHGFWGNYGHLEKLTILYICEKLEKLFFIDKVLFYFKGGR